MDILLIAISIIFSLGVTLGVGSSTFALTNFIVALRDGTIDESERGLMHVVYTVLRIGMILIALGLLGSLLYGYTEPTAQYLMQWTLLAIISLNAVAMTYHKISMRIGPVLAGGSWYALFFVTELPVTDVKYIYLFGGYAVFVLIFFLVFEYIKKQFLPMKS